MSDANSDANSDSNQFGSWILVAAGFFGATAVALGAFHAHGMERWLEQQSGSDPGSPFVAKRMEQCATGLKYQMAHAVALLALASAARIRPVKMVSAAGVMFTIGTVLFSGSLYLIVFRGITAFGAIAPLGGLSLIVGWVLVAAVGLMRR